MAQLGYKFECGVGDSNYQKTSFSYYFGTPFLDRVESASGGRYRNTAQFIDIVESAAELRIKTGKSTDFSFLNPNMAQILLKTGRNGAKPSTETQATEPNQALQRMNMLVTDRAPSSTLRAKHVHR